MCIRTADPKLLTSTTLASPADFTSFTPSGHVGGDQAGLIMSARDWHDNDDYVAIGEHFISFSVVSCNRKELIEPSIEVI